MAEKTQKLGDNYLIELFKACTVHLSVLEIVCKHLQDHFLPDDSYKRFFKNIKQFYELNNKCSTIGILNERFKDDNDVLELLVEIRNTKTPDAEQLLPTLQTFIKEVRFSSLFTETAKLWNLKDEEARPKAIHFLAEESSAIHSFSLKDGVYEKVFFNFNERHEKRKLKDKHDIQKVQFGIHPMDYDTRGGGRIGTSGLMLGRSGSGKTTFLEWVAINNARRGGNTVHFQIEGTEEELLQAYDAAWTGVDLMDIEFGDIKKDVMIRIKNVNRDILNNKGEIFVIAPESFDSLTIESCNETIEEIEKLYGKVSLALFDNIELFETKGKFATSEAGERKRREVLANKVTNIAVNKKLFSLATTQATDIPPIKWDSPDFVMTRSDISEFKGMVRPFSYFWTLNITRDEYESNCARIYNDKFRKHKAGQIRKIATSYDSSRFYDSSRTLNSFWDAKLNQPK